MMSNQVVRSVRRVSLIEVVYLRGKGTPIAPYREVTGLFDDAGVCVAEHDPVVLTPWYAPSETE